MTSRNIQKALKKWSLKKNRKPLVLRGARQVGKTTVIDLFSKQFDQYIYLNLELTEEKILFERNDPFEDLVRALFFRKNAKRHISRTLLFIDEIQNSPAAVKSLRYFYEKAPDIFVIAAGSLLESLIDNHISFPVGRVEYVVLRPFDFYEFLSALKEEAALEAIDSIPVPDYAHDTLLRFFHHYTLIGGMPEVVATYADTKDPLELSPVYESLLVSYMDDVEKYALSSSQARIIRYTIQHALIEAGQRIKFAGFGKGPYKSREIGEAMRILEKAMFLHLIYPATGTIIPLEPHMKKSPRLQLVDTGLLNYYSGIQKNLYPIDDLCSVYQGKIAEHIVGQEILAVDFSPLRTLSFWVQEKKQSNAQVDYLYPYRGFIFPVEVKAGKSGRLRSLHQFVDHSPHPYAVRLYSGSVSLEKTRTPAGKDYTLLNLPYYLAGRLEPYLDSLIDGRFG